MKKWLSLLFWPVMFIGGIYSYAATMTWASISTHNSAVITEWRQGCIQHQACEYDKTTGDLKWSDGEVAP